MEDKVKVTRIRVGGADGAVESCGQMPIVCQCVVRAGGGDDYPGMSGIAHLAEHLLIHSFDADPYFCETKLHGETNFCHTCYYWYVSGWEEAAESLERFKGYVGVLRGREPGDAFLEEVKREVAEEILFFKERNERLARYVRILGGGASHLPIGDAGQVGAIGRADVSRFFNEEYLPENMCFYAFDRAGAVFGYDSGALSRLIGGQGGGRDGDAPPGRLPPVLVERHGSPSSVRKAFFPNLYTGEIEDCIAGEIAVTQLCEWLDRSIGGEVSYEPFFMARDKCYYVVTLSGTKPRALEGEYEIGPGDREGVIPEAGFCKYRDSFSGFFERGEVSEEDVRGSLNLYSAFEYPSYLFVGEGMASIIKNMSYGEYVRRIEKMLKELPSIPCIVIYDDGLLGDIF